MGHVNGRGTARGCTCTVVLIAIMSVTIGNYLTHFFLKMMHRLTQGDPVIFQIRYSYMSTAIYAEN